ncbi:MAG: hypothetical protein ACYDA3_01370 [Gaiellaceae bacterium]
MEEWLDGLETMSDEARWTSLAFVAGQSVEIPEDELNEALRRALVVRAVGGDPTRELELGETSVTRLADEVAADERRAQLQSALAELRPRGAGRPAVAEAIVVLLADAELAWRCYAAALIAGELA